MLNLCLWIGNICNGLLLGNASIARGLTWCKKKRKSQDTRRQENHGEGGGKTISGHWSNVLFGNINIIFVTIFNIHSVTNYEAE